MTGRGGADVSSNYYTTETACSCPDWQYRGRERACKHVRRLREAVETVEGQRRHNAALQGAPGRTDTGRRRAWRRSLTTPAGLRDRDR